MRKTTVNEILSDFWVENYTYEHNPTCMLCQNHGTVKVLREADLQNKRLHYDTYFCVCPNGRILRKSTRDTKKQWASKCHQEGSWQACLYQSIPVELQLGQPFPKSS